MRKEELTRICGCECSCLREVTIPRILAISLVIKIHGKGSVWCHSVWLKTGASRLDRTAVDTVAASIVEIGLQLNIGDAGLGHTPLRRSRIRRWSHRSCWSLRQINQSNAINLRTDLIVTSMEMSSKVLSTNFVGKFHYKFLTSSNERVT